MHEDTVINFNDCSHYLRVCIDIRQGLLTDKIPMANTGTLFLINSEGTDKIFFDITKTR